MRGRCDDRAKELRLGLPNPACLVCGFPAVEALLPTRVSKIPKRLLERHHLAGRAASDFTVILCRNHHAILTDWQEDWHPRLRHPRTPTERLAAFLQGRADLDQVLAQSRGDQAAYLQAWVAWLLAGMPGDGPK